MKTSIKHLLAVSAVTFGLLGSQAHAFNTDDSGVPPQRAEFFQQRMQQLQQDLKLTAPQQKLWDESMATQRQNRDRMMTQRKEMRTQRMALIQSANFHPRELAKLEDSWREKMRATQVAQREQWFKFYDSLSSEQQAKLKATMYARQDARQGGKRRASGRS